MLGDLADQRLAVAIRHRVAGFDLLAGCDEFVEQWHNSTINKRSLVRPENVSENEARAPLAD